MVDLFHSIVMPNLDPETLSLLHLAARRVPIACRRTSSYFAKFVESEIYPSATPWTPLASCPIDRCSPSCQPHTSSSCPPRSKHWRIPQHIRYNEKAHMTPPYVDLIEMADSTIPRGNGDIFELDVHIVFGWIAKTDFVSEVRRQEDIICVRKRQATPSISLPR